MIWFVFVKVFHTDCSTIAREEKFRTKKATVAFSYLPYCRRWTPYHCLHHYIPATTYLHPRCYRKIFHLSISLLASKVGRSDQDTLYWRKFQSFIAFYIRTFLIQNSWFFKYKASGLKSNVLREMSSWRNLLKQEFYF